MKKIQFTCRNHVLYFPLVAMLNFENTSCL